MADFLSSDRIVVGCDAQDAGERWRRCMRGWGADGAHRCGQRGDGQVRGELLLAMKLSYVNAVAELGFRVRPQQAH